IFSKLHKPSKDHKDKPLKDLKEPKSAFRDSGWESSKVSKESSRKPKENQPLRDSNPKMGFKEPKSLSKDHRSEGLTHGSGLNKRLSTLDSEDLMTKKRRKGYLDSSGKQTSGSDSHYSDKKRLQMETSKLRPDQDEAERRKASRLPPFQELVDPNDSDMEDQSKSDVSRAQYLFILWSDGFRTLMLGPLQSVVQDLQSDDNDEDSEDIDDNDMDSDADRPTQTRLTHHQRRLVTSRVIAYLDELVELHKRLMTLREGHILQQIVNLIEETGHFHITNTTFDFDLCSLDRSTVRKLQSYLETSGLS
uniref:MLLT3 super elongation complex subunit n=1 Tax=Fundulus heteroclitus TaxID=8078 RepID=A0A3Q2Q7V9_FUNHE